LKGGSLSAKAKFFEHEGSCSIFAHGNIEALKGWLRKLRNGNYDSPLDWVQKMTKKNPQTRLSAPQLMELILECEEEDLYYCDRCDGNGDDTVAVELRNSDCEELSDHEGMGIVS
jgi:hypothetical protein